MMNTRETPKDFETEIREKYHPIVKRLPLISNIDGDNPLQRRILMEALAKFIRWNPIIAMMKPGFQYNGAREGFAFDSEQLVKKLWNISIFNHDPEKIKEFIMALGIYRTANYGLGKEIEKVIMRERARYSKVAAANVTPVRQRTQYTCVAASLSMCLQALGKDFDEDTVNEVMGAAPKRGASWENAIAAAQYFGCRSLLMCPCSIPQLKEWTDQGFPVMIGWNPENREWSHASVVFDVDADDNVYVADPNIPDPEQTVRVVSRKDFYSKWLENGPGYFIRRAAMAILPEITQDGRQVMASDQTVRQRKLQVLDHIDRKNPGNHEMRDIYHRIDQAIPLESEQAAKLKRIMQTEGVKDTSGLFMDKGLIPHDGILASTIDRIAHRWVEDKE